MYRGASSPGRNAKLQGKVQRGCRCDGEADGATEWITGFFDDMHGGAVDAGGNHVAGGSEPDPQGQREAHALEQVVEASADRHPATALGLDGDPGLPAPEQDEVDLVAKHVAEVAQLQAFAQHIASEVAQAQQMHCQQILKTRAL